MKKIRFGKNMRISRFEGLENRELLSVSPWLETDGAGKDVFLTENVSSEVILSDLALSSTISPSSESPSSKLLSSGLPSSELLLSAPLSSEIALSSELLSSELLSSEDVWDSEELIYLENSFDPSPEEQELLELVNRMRMFPQQELDWFFESLDELDAYDPRVDLGLLGRSYPRDNIESFLDEWSRLEPVDPLAWSGILYQVAAVHNMKMIQYDSLSHQLTMQGEAALEDRVLDAGYEAVVVYDAAADQWTTELGENVFGAGRGRFDEFTVASFIHAAFAIDWGVPEHGHRDNLMNANYNEVGISVLSVVNSLQKLGPWVSTVDFGKSVSSETAGGYVLGVLFDDLNADGFYQAGEGLGGISLTISELGTSVLGTSSQETSFQEPSSQETSFERTPLYSLTSMSAGGYQVFLPNGSYEIVVQGGKFGEGLRKTLTVDGANVKLDFITSDIDNVPPILSDSPLYQPVFREGEDAVHVLSSDFQIVDSDSVFIQKAEIVLCRQPDAPYEYLDLDLSGTSLTLSQDSASGKLLLSGRASVSVYERVLKSLLYFNAKDRLSDADRQIDIRVFDGTQWSSSLTQTIGVEMTFLPSLTVDEAVAWEGDFDGENYLKFFVSLSEPARKDVLIQYSADMFGNNPLSISEGILEIRQGETLGIISLPVWGNTAQNSDFSVQLNLLSVENAALSKKYAVGKILDDDVVIELGTLSHWELSSPLIWTSEYRRIYSFNVDSEKIVSWLVNTSESLTLRGSLPGTSLPSSNLTNSDFSSVSGSDVSILRLYEISHGNPPILISETVGDSAQLLQWKAQSGVQYLLMVESSLPIETLIFNELDIDDSGQILIDPILGDSGEICMIPSVDSSDGFYLQGENGSYFISSEMSHTGFFGFKGNKSGALRLTLPPAQLLDFSSGYIRLDEMEIGLEYFDDIIIDGSFSREQVWIIGTDGNDHFEFDNGSAVLRLSTGQSIFFSQIGSLEIAGSGGYDSAIIYDTPGSDLLDWTPDAFRFWGDLAQLTLVGFKNIQVNSLYGGRDDAVIHQEIALNTIVQPGALWMTSGSGFDPTANKLADEQIFSLFNFTSISVQSENIRNRIAFLVNPLDDILYSGTMGCLSAQGISGSLVQVVGDGIFDLRGVTPEMYKNLKIQATDDLNYTSVRNDQGLFLEDESGRKLNFWLKSDFSWSDFSWASASETPLLTDSLSEESAVLSAELPVSDDDLSSAEICSAQIPSQEVWVSDVFLASVPDVDSNNISTLIFCFDAKTNFCSSISDLNSSFNFNSIYDSNKISGFVQTEKNVDEFFKPFFAGAGFYLADRESGFSGKTAGQNAAGQKTANQKQDADLRNYRSLEELLSLNLI